MCDQVKTATDSQNIYWDACYEIQAGIVLRIPNDKMIGLFNDQMKTQSLWRAM